MSTKTPVAKPVGSKKPTKSQLAAAAKLGLQEEPVLKAPPQAGNAMDFAVQQLSSKPVPQEAIPEPTFGGITETPEFKAALAQALAKQSKPGKESKPRAEKIVQHGVSRPAPGTACARVWDAADEITAKVAGPAPIALLKAALHGMNDHTIKTQYARWRTFNGITGRVVLTTAAPATAAE